MARTYSYRCKDRTGQLFTGTILADSEAAVAAHIRQDGRYVTDIREIKEQFSLENFIASLRPVSTKDMSVLCRQFSTMINAGLPLISCLNILIEQTYNPRIKGALQDVYKRVKEGEPLAKAMRSHKAVFPDIMVSMVDAGEVGGVLDDVLMRLAAHFEKEHKLNERVKSAMTYPAVVIFMAILSITFILTFVLPTFMQMFADMKVSLPLPTRILLMVSGILRSYGVYLLALLGIASYGLAYAAGTPGGKKWVDQLVLELPVFGILARKVAIARFSRTLGTLIHGGIPIITAMDVVKHTAGNAAMVEALTDAQASVREGQGMAVPLKNSSIFPPMVVQMVSVGEETGQLDQMLEKIADFYENDVDDMVNRLSSMLEPILIGVLGVAIGFIVISIMLPLFDIVTNFGKPM